MVIASVYLVYSVMFSWSTRWNQEFCWWNKAMVVLFPWDRKYVKFTGRIFSICLFFLHVFLKLLSVSWSLLAGRIKHCQQMNKSQINRRKREMPLFFLQWFGVFFFSWQVTFSDAWNFLSLRGSYCIAMLHKTAPSILTVNTDSGTPLSNEIFRTTLVCKPVSDALCVGVYFVSGGL